MKIAFATQDDKGLNSPVYDHFGSARYFIIVDSDTDHYESIINPDRDHPHGQCQPLLALGRDSVDAVVVGGIGAGALGKLNHAGVNIYRGVEGTVIENLRLMKSGLLPLFTKDQTCAGHAEHGHCTH